MYSQLISSINDLISNHNGVVILPFAEEHFGQIQISQSEIISASAYIDIKAMVLKQDAIGISFTAFMYGNPVAIFGCVPIWHGVGEMWSILDNRSKKNAISLTKIAFKVLYVIEQYLMLHRSQITVKSADKKAVRWAMALGFKNEGTMKSYRPDGSDFYIMARTAK
jgi:hypothetical protein